MAVPVARVHLKVAHAALPALLPTPPKFKMLPFVAAAVPPKLPATAKPRRADADERWDAHKTKSASTESSATTSVGRGSSSRKSGATSSLPPKPGRADAVDRWDAHKKAASPASSSSSSSSGTSSLASSNKWPFVRAMSAERWDVHKNRRPLQRQVEPLDDGESSSNDMDTEEEEIVWKPRAMYAGVGWTGLRRRCARTQHAFLADIVLGSCCIALHCTNCIDRIRRGLRPLVSSAYGSDQQV